jgi:hypothetical protein
MQPEKREGPNYFDRPLHSRYQHAAKLSADGIIEN